jgi:hypothetical protein
MEVKLTYIDLGKFSSDVKDEYKKTYEKDYNLTSNDPKDKNIYRVRCCYLDEALRLHKDGKSRKLTLKERKELLKG